MEPITDALIAGANSPWVYAVIFALCLIDGVFPPLPSESAVVALAAISVSTGQPALLPLAAAAAAGAVAGDNLAYLLGRTVGIDRFRWMRRPVIARLFAWAGAQLTRRPASLILAARYVPGGRVAVNMMAGATRLSHRFFLVLTVIAGCTWAAYSIGIAALTASWLGHHPLLAAAGAVLFALVLGFAVDRVFARWSGRHDRRPTRGSRV